LRDEGDGADTFGGLQDDHLAAGLRQPPSDRKTDHPRTDNDTLNLVHSQFESGNIVGYSTGRAPSWHPTRVSRAYMLSLCSG